MYFDSLTGHDANTGTPEAPKLDPSKAPKGCGGIALRAGRGVYRVAGRVKLQSGTPAAPFVLTRWGEGANPVIDGRNDVDLVVDGIDTTDAALSGVNIVNAKVRGIHLGSSGADPATPRRITISNTEIRYSFGAPIAGGIAAWGADIVYRSVRIDGCRDDCLWHRGTTFEAYGLDLSNPSAWSEGTGDCFQVTGLRDRLLVKSLRARKSLTTDKQAGYFSGAGVPMAVCQVDDLDAEGLSSGAGLVTLIDLPGLRGTGWRVNLTGGSAAAAVGGLGNMAGARIGFVPGGAIVPAGRVVVSGGVVADVRTA